MALDLIKWTLALTLAALSIVNTLLICFTCYYGSKVSLFHQNFRLLQLSVLFSFLFISSGCLLSTILIFKDGTVDVDTKISEVVECVKGYGVCFLRVTLLAFFVERAFATVKRAVYEKKPYWWLILLLIVIIHLTSIGMIISMDQGVIDVLVFLFITLSLDIISLVFILILRWWNRRLKKLSLVSFLSFTQRYQITENIRAMNAIHPLLLSTTSFNLFSMGLSTILMLTNFFLDYTLLIFYLIMNICIITVILLSLSKENTYREKILYQLPLLRGIIKKVKTKTSTNKVIAVNDKYGIIVKNTDMYFDMLKVAWK